MYNVVVVSVTLLYHIVVVKKNVDFIKQNVAAHCKAIMLLNYKM